MDIYIDTLPNDLRAVMEMYTFHWSPQEEQDIIDDVILNKVVHVPFSEFGAALSLRIRVTIKGVGYREYTIHFYTYESPSPNN